MSPEPPITLSAGTLELTPKSLDWRQYFRVRVDRAAIAASPILRKCNSCHENVLEAASFPLVPYVNRIRGGRFTFRGREVRLAPNMAGDPSPLHGQGWLAPWQVEQRGRVGGGACRSITRPANGRGSIAPSSISSSTSAGCRCG